MHKHVQQCHEQITQPERKTLISRYYDEHHDNGRLHESGPLSENPDEEFGIEDSWINSFD